MSPQFKAVELFGGAIAARVPIDFRDASDFREVPDHQEVYVSMTDDVDISIIFDILQRVKAPSDADAADFHFEDVAVDQGRTAKVWSKRLVSLPHLPDNPPSYQVIGTVSARPTDVPTVPPTFTAILMTIVRLEKQTTDIVMTINIPFHNPAVVSTEKCIASPAYTGDDIDPETGHKSELLAFGMQVVEEVVDSFRIADWRLFMTGEEL